MAWLRKHFIRGQRGARKLVKCIFTRWQWVEQATTQMQVQRPAIKPCTTPTGVFPACNYYSKFDDDFFRVSMFDVTNYYSRASGRSYINWTMCCWRSIFFCNLCCQTFMPRRDKTDVFARGTVLILTTSTVLCGPLTTCVAICGAPFLSVWCSMRLSVYLSVVS